MLSQGGGMQMGFLPGKWIIISYDLFGFSLRLLVLAHWVGWWCY